MPPPKKPNLGAVSAEYVFIDIVGYSKRLIEHQTDIIGVLNRIVLKCVTKHRLPDDRVLFLPTGDGMCIALLNIDNPADIQIQIALGILQRVHDYNSRIAEGDLRFQVRIGISAKKDNVIIDINGNRNIAGAGINETARIMAEADGGQILVGDRVVGDLKPHGKYVSAFRPYTAVVKHGVALPLHQFIGKGYDFLNVDVPLAFRTPADIRAQKGPRSREARLHLRRGGLKIRVTIGPPAAEVRWAKLSNLEVRPPLPIMALIDTGASITVINPQVAITCGLRQIGEVRISATGHVTQAPEYIGAIRFPEARLKAFDPVRLVACSLPGQDVSCILGRDILENWRLVYDGRTGEVEIEE